MDLKKIIRKEVKKLINVFDSYSAFNYELPTQPPEEPEWYDPEFAEEVEEKIEDIVKEAKDSIDFYQHTLKGITNQKKYIKRGYKKIQQSILKQKDKVANKQNLKNKAKKLNNLYRDYLRYLDKFEKAIKQQIKDYKEILKDADDIEIEAEYGLYTSEERKFYHLEEDNKSLARKSDKLEDYYIEEQKKYKKLTANKFVRTLLPSKPLGESYVYKMY